MALALPSPARVGRPGNVPTPPRAEADEPRGPGVLRNVALAIFLLYCLLPAVWILAAMTKDNGQIFTTFGFWFASPTHFYENLVKLFTHQNSTESSCAGSATRCSTRGPSRWAAP